MIYEDNILQGDLVLNPSIMLLAHGVNVIDTCLHNSPGIPEVRYDNLADGWYTAYQISVPDQEWLDYTFATCPETLSSYNTIYYVADNQLYKFNYWNNTTSVADSADLIKSVNGITNIKISFLDFFITSKLEEEFQSLLEESLQDKGCQKQQYCCKSKDKDTDNLIETRDQLNNILDMIQMYLDCNDFESAQDLLDKYNNCFKVSDKICCRRPL